VVYHLKVVGRTRFLCSHRGQCEDPSENYFIHHARYSELRSLHMQLKKYHTMEDLPEFPSKRILFMGFATSAIKVRILGLNQYFEDLLKIDVIAQSEILLKFFSPENSLTVTIVGSSKALTEFMNLGHFHKIPPQIAKITTQSADSQRRPSSTTNCQLGLSALPPIDICHDRQLHRFEFVEFNDMSGVNESDLMRNHFDFILLIHSDQENLSDLEAVRMKIQQFSGRTLTLDTSFKDEEDDVRNQFHFLLQEMINMRSYNKL
jgi:hypothetical protein